ncbi:hypothetical protein BDCR2A_01046 [Borrelia duttonii CR2A]|uniref:Uncharacterized protein n=1 Tax=Borrelia duttonii CR2A TaxID=1432657 RepID=W6TJZ2_9SPIR|nr:hypothetical protein BDCR2A_01954 [Borrelia duttonii CR2A]ETZ19073.1 hypothetical protein BDCR2A_01046 [Borrelia duttonii CR2A]
MNRDIDYLKESYVMSQFWTKSRSLKFFSIDLFDDEM